MHAYAPMSLHWIEGIGGRGRRRGRRRGAGARPRRHVQHLDAGDGRARAPPRDPPRPARQRPLRARRRAALHRALRRLREGRVRPPRGAPRALRRPFARHHRLPAPRRALSRARAQPRALRPAARTRPTPRAPTSPRAARRRAARAWPACRRSPRRSCRRRPRPTRAPTSRSPWRWCASRSCARTPRATRAAARRSPRRSPWTPRRSRCPTLLVTGEDDAVAPAADRCARSAIASRARASWSIRAAGTGPPTNGPRSARASCATSSPSSAR